MRTASTVTKAAAIRRGVIAFFPPPVKPMRSTMSEVAPCPAMEATE